MALRGHTRVLCNAGEERHFVLVQTTSYVLVVAVPTWLTSLLRPDLKLILAVLAECPGARQCCLQPAVSTNLV